MKRKAEVLDEKRWDMVTEELEAFAITALELHIPIKSLVSIVIGYWIAPMRRFQDRGNHFLQCEKTGETLKLKGHKDDKYRFSIEELTWVGEVGYYQESIFFHPTFVNAIPIVNINQPNEKKIGWFDLSGCKYTSMVKHTETCSEFSLDLFDWYTDEKIVSANWISTELKDFSSSKIQVWMMISKPIALIWFPMGQLFVISAGATWKQQPFETRNMKPLVILKEQDYKAQICVSESEFSGKYNISTGDISPIVEAPCPDVLLLIREPTLELIRIPNEFLQLVAQT